MADQFLEARGEGAARLAAEIAEAERQERERLAEALHDDALQRLLVARQDLAEAAEDSTALCAVQRQLDELTDALPQRGGHAFGPLGTSELAMLIDPGCGIDGFRRSRP